MSTEIYISTTINNDAAAIQVLALLRDDEDNTVGAATSYASRTCFQHATEAKPSCSLFVIRDASAGTGVFERRLEAIISL